MATFVPSYGTRAEILPGLTQKSPREAPQPQNTVCTELASVLAPRMDTFRKKKKKAISSLVFFSLCLKIDDTGFLTRSRYLMSRSDRRLSQHIMSLGELPSSQDREIIPLSFSRAELLSPTSPTCPCPCQRTYKHRHIVMPTVLVVCS